MRITLISWTRYPETIISMMARNMKGEFYNNVETYTTHYREKISQDLKELFKTNLQAPFEFVHFIFQIEDVPRAFTHQLVRYRVGVAYSQESLRFVVKTGKQFKYLTPDKVYENRLTAEYDNIMGEIQAIYENLIKQGLPTEDARGVLPINILTKIGVMFSYRTLIHIAETRLCLQAQSFWREAVQKMKEEIAKKVSNDLADHLQPICYRTKKCEFASMFDRPCPLQEKFPK